MWKLSYRDLMTTLQLLKLKKVGFSPTCKPAHQAKRILFRGPRRYISVHSSPWQNIIKLHCP